MPIPVAPAESRIVLRFSHRLSLIVLVCLSSHTLQTSSGSCPCLYLVSCQSNCWWSVVSLGMVDKTVFHQRLYALGLKSMHWNIGFLYLHHLVYPWCLFLTAVSMQHLECVLRNDANIGLAEGKNSLMNICLSWKPDFAYRYFVSLWPLIVCSCVMFFKCDGRGR